MRTKRDLAGSGAEFVILQQNTLFYRCEVNLFDEDLQPRQISTLELTGATKVLDLKLRWMIG